MINFLFQLHKLNFKRIKIRKLSKEFEDSRQQYRNQDEFESKDGNNNQMESALNLAKHFMGDETLINLADKYRPDKDPKNNKDDKIREDKLCDICYERPQCCLYKPCNHGGFCKDCSVTIFDQDKKCPICRKEIEFVVIYELKDDGKLYQIDQYPNFAEIN